MIETLMLPRELVYMSKVESSYEQFMADDPTGINRVLDKMYGAAFNSSDIDLAFAEPSIYFDCAYELATRIWLQMYPHRYLKMQKVFNCAEKSLNEAKRRLEEIQPAPQVIANPVYQAVRSSEIDEDDIYLVLWMAYCLLSLRSDNTDGLTEFLGFYSDYIEADDILQCYPVNRLLDAVLKKQIEDGLDPFYDCDLTPQPAPLASIEQLDLHIFDHLLYEKDVTFLIRIFQDVPTQQGVYQALLAQQVVRDTVPDLTERIAQGEFLPAAASLPPLPADASEGDKLFRERCMRELETMRRQVNYYKQRCQCYEQKEQLASSVDKAAELGKGVNEQLQQDYDQLKQETDEIIQKLRYDLDKTQARADEAIRKCTEQENTKKKKVAKPTIDMEKILLHLAACMENPKIITDQQFDGAERLLHKLIDFEEVEKAIGMEVSNSLSKRFRLFQDVRQENKMLLQQAEERKEAPSQINVYGNYTEQNGPSIDRNYGPNVVVQPQGKSDTDCLLEHLNLQSAEGQAKEIAKK